jgi:hypothetical protein
VEAEVEPHAVPTRHKTQNWRLRGQQTDRLCSTPTQRTPKQAKSPLIVNKETNAGSAGCDVGKHFVAGVGILPQARKQRCDSVSKQQNLQLRPFYTLW